MVSTAYYDESGTHDGSPITVLGGLVGQAEHWAEFEREWKKILAKYNLPYIRAKQLFHKQGPYKKWRRKQIDYLNADLMYVIQEHTKHFQVTKTVLTNEDYYRSYRADGPISKKERLDTRYGLCLRACLHFLPRLHHIAGADDVLNLILESGHRNAGDALRIFNDIKSTGQFEWSKSIGSLSFGTKADFPALQAADMISYWFYKTEMEKIEDQIEDPYEISDLERELASLGMVVIDHMITPFDLALLRQNFLAKKKREVFDKVRAVMNIGDHIRGAWDSPYAKELIGVEFSAKEVSRSRLQIDPYSQTRYR
ncbi:DUF3800 domain-containing protein [Rhodopseudomonas palustris]|nr:DUF3800 domain-containing protein [Rhodopseudomonas palustris]